jgi:hypothetical protein
LSTKPAIEHHQVKLEAVQREHYLVPVGYRDKLDAVGLYLVDQHISGLGGHERTWIVRRVTGLRLAFSTIRLSLRGMHTG